MPTYVKLPAGVAKGIDHRRVNAAYGMQQTLTKIAAANQTTKTIGIVQATWLYRPGYTTLVKAPRK